MFIIDFDDTLFHTHGFKQARVHSLVQAAVSLKDIHETYREAYQHNGLASYSNHIHADFLSLRGYDHDRVLEALEATTGDALRDFLFPDTVDFVHSLKSMGKPVVLLSLGDPSMQELKVKGSGIHDYFDRVFMVSDNKEHVLQELISVGEREEDLWFINDKVEETLRVSARFPRMRAVLKKSDSIDESEYVQSNLPYFNTLTEIYDYIITYQK